MVVLIIGILAALAIPNYRKVVIKSKATATVNNLRTFSAALGNFNLANGRYPSPGAAPGDPGELGIAVTDTFKTPSPIGGKYMWHISAPADPFYGKASLSIATDSDSALTNDTELLELVDQMIDDGDLTSGNLQYGAADLVYIIEK